MTMRDLIHLDRPFHVPALRRDSFARSLTSLQKQMDQLMAGFFDVGTSPAAFPSIDITEKDKNFKVKIELAGISPDDIELSVTDGFLTVSGDKSEEQEEEKDNYLRRESSYGSFSRTIALPETADCDAAEASFKNGVLRISIPKKAEALQKPKKLNIKKAA